MTTAEYNKNYSVTDLVGTSEIEAFEIEGNRILDEEEAK